jgi:hypothetical protein
MSKQKTAVQTLEQRIKEMDIIPSDKNELLISRSDLAKLINLAKKQEERQIVEAVEWNYKSNMGQVYYDATYGVS